MRHGQTWCMTLARFEDFVARVGFVGFVSFVSFVSFVKWFTQKRVWADEALS